MTEATAASIATEPTLQARCLRCEYDLRGLPRDARCPECGTPAEPSWQRAEAERAALPPLHLSSPSWLRTMAIACCLMIASALLTAVEAWRLVGGSQRGGDNWGFLPVVFGLSH